VSYLSNLNNIFTFATTPLDVELAQLTKQQAAKKTKAAATNFIFLIQEYFSVQ
jgi:hypothetical protein